MTLFGLLESNCEEKVIKNASTWVTISGGQIVPSLTIQRHLCPNLCSGHGTCSNGVCYCNRGKFYVVFILMDFVALTRLHT